MIYIHKIYMAICECARFRVKYCLCVMEKVIGRILSVSHHMRNIQCSGLTVFCAPPDLAIML